MIPLDQLPELIRRCLRIRDAVADLFKTSHT
jgi:hypothetical protein